MLAKMTELGWLDPETARQADAEPITEAMAALEQEGRLVTARQHRAERWRDYLLEAGDPAVSELLNQRRDADAQAIRQLIRKGRSEVTRGRPPAAWTPTRPRPI